MSAIVLQTTAIKVTNKGGGIKQTVDKSNNVFWSDDTGSDYVTFVCPHPKCGHRNKQSMYEAENYHDPANDRIPFKCRKCRSVIEVTRPASVRPLIIVPGAEVRRSQPGGIIVNGTELGRT
jgi:hypothetical protein